MDLQQGASTVNVGRYFMTQSPKLSATHIVIASIKKPRAVAGLSFLCEELLVFNITASVAVIIPYLKTIRTVLFFALRNTV